MYATATVTLTTSAQSLKTLVEAVLGESLPQSIGREVLVQVANDAGGIICVGDSSLTSSNRGYEMMSHESRLYRHPMQMDWLYVLSTTNGDKLNVEIMG